MALDIGEKYVLGLDIGITSVGWALVDKESMELIDGGVRLFEEADAENNQKRREKRSNRRTKRRRKYRLNRVDNLFIKAGYFDDEDDLRGAVSSYQLQNKNVTPYHIRVKGLKEELNPVELYISLYQIAKHRGFFYLDSLDEEELQNVNENALPCKVQLEKYESYMKFLNGEGPESDSVRGKTNLFRNQDFTREVNLIFNNISYLDEEFKKEYIKIMHSKREYDDGPGDENSDSPYKLKIIDEETGKVKSIFIDNLRGHCSFFSEEYCAPKNSYTAELFNLLNDLNNTSFDGEKLTKDQKLAVIDYAKYKAAKSKTELKKVDIERALNQKFKLILGARENKKKESIFTAMTGFVKIREICKACEYDVHELDDRQLIDEIVEVCAVGQHDEQRFEALDELFKSKSVTIPQNLLEELSKVSFTGFHSLCTKIMDEVISDMIDTNQNSMQIFKEFGYLKLLFFKYQKSNLQAMDDMILSSAVKRSYNQSLRIVKAVTKKYGELDSVVIELARENNSTEQKEYLKHIQQLNEKNNKDINKILEDNGFYNQKINGELATKLRFYNEQDCKDIYTGETIDLHRLINDPKYCEIDHIIPISVNPDDSLNNKVLTFSHTNNQKSNRTPYKFFNERPLSETKRSYDSFKKDVISNKKISKKKLMNLLNEEDIDKYSVRMGFVQRNLVDTRYSTRQVFNQLKYFYEYNQIDTKVFAINGSLTSFLRHVLKLKKNRDNFRHHAEDAYLIALAGSTNLIQQLHGKNIDESVMNSETGEVYNLEEFKNNQLPYDVKMNVEYAEFKFSHRVEKNITGQVFNETIYSTRKKDDIEYVVKDFELRNPDVKLEKYFKESGKYYNAMLMKEYDIRTFEYLCKIYEDYAPRVKNFKTKNPFVAYELDTGEVIRKYSKKGNGPKIVKCKYRDHKLNLHKNISRKYKNLENNKNIVLESMSPFRIDVYQSDTDKVKYKYVVVSKHMLNMTSKDGKPIMVINKLEYDRRKQDRKIDDSYKFIFSLYRRDIVEIDNDDEIYKGYFIGSMSVSANQIEIKPISHAPTVKQDYKTIGRTTRRFKKIVTDVLGNEYEVTNEKFVTEFPYKQVVQNRR